MMSFLLLSVWRKLSMVENGSRFYCSFHLLRIGCRACEGLEIPYCLREDEEEEND